nr:TlpA disulfide reductase family protein [Nitrosomonas nitrosa]
MSPTSTIAIEIGALRRAAARACRAGGASLLVILAGLTPLRASGHDVLITWHAVPRHLPLFFFTSDASGPMTLRQFRGRIVLLNVWATWCPTCRRELPTLDRVRKKLGGKEFEVVALSIDRDGAEAIAPFFSEIGIKNLGIYIDRRGTVLGEYTIVGLPTTLIINRDGREIGRLTGPADWDTPEVAAMLRRIIAGRSNARIEGEP